MIDDIINNINKLSNNIVFNKDDILEGYNYIIKTFNDIKYYNYGGSVICFYTNNKIIKLCKKDTSTLQNLQYYIDILLKNELIPNTKILFENNDCLVYEQAFVNQIYIITKKVVKDILELFQKFISLNIISTDNFYKNFGYLNNKLVLFDIHDFIELTKIEDNNKLNVLGFSQTFYYLFYDKYRSIGLKKTIEEIIESNFCSDIFPIEYSNFLKNIYNCNYDCHIKIDCSNKYINYQYININENGYMSLDNHTLLKYNLISNFKDYNSVLDAGCSLGGIGLKLAYDNPNIFITLNNMTDNELNTAREISSNCTILNVNFDDRNLINITESYDLTLYFAILHHIIRTIGVKNTMELIKKQTNMYSIIEIPFKGDALLNKVFNGNYDNIIELCSVDNFIKCLKEYNFELLEYGHIYYPNSSDLNRYYFKLKKNEFLYSLVN